MKVLALLLKSKVYRSPWHLFSSPTVTTVGTTPIARVWDTRALGWEMGRDSRLEREGQKRESKKKVPSFLFPQFRYRSGHSRHCQQSLSKQRSFSSFPVDLISPEFFWQYGFNERSVIKEDGVSASAYVCVVF